jgi:capsular polysaccharide export protein
VGLSWRSSLTTYSRNEHYLSVEDLAPIFALEDVQFVNLQYDDCSEELKWIEDRFPGRVFNFKDLDQYNDLDGVAALMACMDIVVSPATTVVELSGALGCPTLLLSNSSELHWRKRPGTKTDCWHSSITHVEGKQLGNKVDLISELFEFLSKDFVGSKNTDEASSLELRGHAGLLA